MEKIIGNLERDLRDIIDGKPVKNLRGEMGDKMDIRALRMVVFPFSGLPSGINPP